MSAPRLTPGLGDRARAYLWLLVTSLLVAGAAPLMPQWTATGDSAGLPGLHPTNTMTPLWFDLDGDGNPNPIWFSSPGAVTTAIGEQGEVLVAVDLPSSLEVEDGPSLLGVALDADGDGTLELLAFGRELVLLKLGEDLSFTTLPSVLPSLPASFLSDIAVGDLNADGLPDLVLGLGLLSSERIDLSGPPDVVLMNLGEGRFELHRIEPARDGFSNSLTLADLDGDGRLDIVESVDASSVSGLSRSLLNRTSPGARVPVFEVLEVNWDIGTFGMGAAIADVNGDGYMDIYNSSVGLDLLTLGAADGSYTDVTLERGIGHEWATVSMRSQWSPSILDLNADGLLDILVRQGDQGAASSAGMSELTSIGTDLVYIQDEAGHFHRGDVPFNPGSPVMGRQAVSGDRDGDGLPDVALGGLNGAATFWTNDTEPPATTRVLTLRFETTVSAWPPTGARVIGTCGEMTWTRHLTSGGHMGGSSATEIYAAWPDCADAPSLEVQWPSGARSTHQPEAGQTTLVAHEPAWWLRSDDDVILDPTDAGASKACLGTDQGQWSCCAAVDAPCTLPLPLTDGSPLVALDDRPAMALFPEPGWVIHTSPSPPRPGQEVHLTVMHVGDPSSFVPETTSIWVDGEVLVQGASAVDSELRIIRASTEVAEGSPALQVTFFPLDLLPDVTWTLATGLGIDSRWIYQKIYPYRIVGGVTEFWSVAIYTTLIRGVLAEELLEPLAVETSAGVDIPVIRQYLDGNIARARVLVESADLEGLDEIVFLDRGANYQTTIALPPPLTLDEAGVILDHVDGGISKTRTRGVGDQLPLFITLRDKSGRVLQPELDLITIEADGAYLSAPLLLFGSTYNLIGMLHTEPGEEPGEVRVRAVDGRLLGSYPFERIHSYTTAIDLSLSTATLTPILTETESLTSHMVTIHGRSARGELMGANFELELVVEGGDLVGSPRLMMAGDLVAHMLAHPTATEIEVEVWLNGELLNTLSAPLDPSPVADVDAGTDVGSVADIVDTADIAEPLEEPPPQSSGSGCGGCAGGDLDSLWSLLALMALAMRRRAWRDAGP